MAEKQHLEKYHVLAKIHGNVASNTSISSLSKYDIHTTCFSDFNFTLGGEEIDRKKSSSRNLCKNMNLENIKLLSPFNTLKQIKSEHTPIVKIDFKK